MLRIGKLTDAALEATLRLFLEPDHLTETHPVYRMLAATPDTLRPRADALADKICSLSNTCTVKVIETESRTGGGALPTVSIPSAALAVWMDGMGADELSRRLRRNEPPVIARIEDKAVILDLRTILPDEDEQVAEAFAGIAPVSGKEN
jgi:L-seryl-tRNA(Ser) seleniumtransferase